jgi:general secretion pathway protein K
MRFSSRQPMRFSSRHPELSEGSAVRPRRGVALLAALWLVIAILTVALQFSMEAKERRTVGILASERAQQRALALGAFQLTRARMEQAHRIAPTGTSVDVLRASDAWLDADSTYSGYVDVDSTPVQVIVRDLGQRININNIQEVDLRTFFSFVLHDMSKATQLSQAIMDWRDVDSLPRPSGAERDKYIKDEMLALPTNSGFREVEDMLNVYGMTPEIFAEVSPFFTTRGNGLVNVNTAPAEVLRALPGMTDATLNRIVMMRSQGRRIRNMGEIFPGAAPAGGGRGQTVQIRVAGQVQNQTLQTQFSNRVTFTTDNVEVTVLAKVGPQSQPTKLVGLLSKTGNGNNLQVRVGNLLW